MRDNVTSSMRAALPPGGSTNDIGILYGPHGQRLLLSLISEVTRSVPGWLTGQG
jgi:beta-lactamase class A